MKSRARRSRAANASADSSRLRRFRLATCLLASWPVLVGCGDAPSRSDWTTARDTLPSGAVRIVHAPPADAAPAWTLVEELRVGSREGAGPDSFGYLKGLVAWEDGGFAVLDSQAQELRVFGPDGAHVATHGGRGQGPGEFVNANGLMAGSDGRLRVPDSRGGRMSVFDPEAGFVESFPFADGTYHAVWNGALVGGDRIYRPWWGIGNRNWLRIYDLAMTAVDSLRLPPSGGREDDPASQPGAFYQEAGGGYMMYSIPFYPHSVRYIDSRGAIWSTRDGDPAYRIARWEPGGDTTLVVETRRSSVAIPAAERDSVIDGMRRITSDMGVGEWDWSRVPAIRPAVEAIFESAEGDLWVRTPADGGGVIFDRYAGDGAWLGSVRPELGLELFDHAPVVRGERVWMIMRDELDVKYVVRARMTPPSG